MSRGIMVEQSTAPDAPGTGQITYYFKTDRMLYTKDDSGLEARAGEVKGADVASATTLNLDTATGNLVDVTGTTTITAITLAEGKWATTRFTGALILTHGASLVLLANGSNITTVAGDIAQWRGYASGVVRMVSYSRLSGTAISTGITIGTEVAGSGTSIDFTGLPSTLRRVTCMLAALSGDGTSNFQVQIGPTGGIETTGYESTASNLASALTPTNAASTTGFLFMGATAATAAWRGAGYLSLEDSANNTWVWTAAVREQTAGVVTTAAGDKSLAGPLTRVRFTTVNGTDAFDAGAVNILYES